MDKLKVFKILQNIKRNRLAEAEFQIKDLLLAKVSKHMNTIKEDILLHFNADAMGYRSLRKIAEDIEKNWKNPSKAAKQYITAMKSLNTIAESYYNDPAKSIVSQFLGTATDWRGPVADKIKLELKAMLVGKKISELTEAPSCALRNRKRMADIGETDEAPEKPEKPKKVRGKYLLTDKEEEEPVKEAFEDDNIIADTDSPKELAFALRNKWATKLEDAKDQFGVAFRFRGKEYSLVFLGKLGGKYKAKIAGKVAVGNDVTDLYNQVVKMVVGQEPAKLKEKLELKDSVNVTYEQFAKAWMEQKEVISGHRPKQQFNNFEVAYEFDEQDGFLRKVFNDKQLREKAINEHLVIEN